MRIVSFLPKYSEVSSFGDMAFDHGIDVVFSECSVERAQMSALEMPKARNIRSLIHGLLSHARV